MKTRQLFLILLTAFLPIAVWADVWQDPETKVNYEYTSGSGEAKVTKSYGISGDITILDIIAIDGTQYKVTEIAESAFENCQNLNKVNIPSSVTFIGDRAFYGCEELSSVKIPSSVTWIGHQAFYNCYSLTNISIPNLYLIGEETFFQCKSLTKVEIPYSVESIWERAFYGS